MALAAQDAALLTSLGQSLMMQIANYSRARELCHNFLSLPDARLLDVEYTCHLVWHGFALIYEGEVDEGLRELRALLNKKLGRIEIRNHLHFLLPEIRNDETFAKVRGFMIEFLQLFPEYDGRPDIRYASTSQ